MGDYLTMTTRISCASAALTTAGLLFIALPLASAAFAQSKPAGADAEALYKKHCIVCHGPDGDSKLPGMSFADGEWKHGTSVKEISTIIKEGVKGTAMLPFKSKLSDEEVEVLAKHVRAFDKNLK
jgi:mono/diheme cytochrome c family protein